MLGEIFNQKVRYWVNGNYQTVTLLGHLDLNAKFHSLGVRHYYFDLNTGNGYKSISRYFTCKNEKMTLNKIKEIVERVQQSW